MINRIVAAVLQVLALLIGSVSAFVLHPAAGGLFFSTGLLIFGLAIEKSGEA